MKRSKWFGLWNNSENHYMISQPINIDEIREFTESESFRLILKRNKHYMKDGNRPYYVFAIGNCYNSAYKTITSEDMQYSDLVSNIKEMSEDELVKFIEKVNGTRLFTYEEVRTVKNGACEDGRCGYSGGDLLVEDYV